MPGPFFAVAFSAAPLILYVPPVRSLNLFVEVVEGLLRRTAMYSERVYPRARRGLSLMFAALLRAFS